MKNVLNIYYLFKKILDTKEEKVFIEIKNFFKVTKKCQDFSNLGIEHRYTVVDSSILMVIFS
jgi:hypothetical protein